LHSFFKGLGLKKAPIVLSGHFIFYSNSMLQVMISLMLLLFANPMWTYFPSNVVKESIWKFKKMKFISHAQNLLQI
jgi:hypothetical protein